MTTEFALTREQAEKEASRLIESEWNVPEHGLPIDPIFIAQRLGVHVYSMALKPEVDGMLKFDKVGEPPVIFIPNDASKNRRRFSVAHELGHFIAQLRMEPSGSTKVPKTDVFYRDPDSRTAKNPLEVFSNQFAAALLMPENYVRALVTEGKSDLSLARYFEVSLEAISHRLKNLGLLAEATR